MGKRFSRSDLFEIRNAISIDRLIAEELDLPVKTSDGRPRFLCPVCNEFQTATNPSTNLARCFRCENPTFLLSISSNGTGQGRAFDR